MEDTLPSRRPRSHVTSLNVTKVQCSTVVVALATQTEQKHFAGIKVPLNQRPLKATIWQEYTSITQCDNCQKYRHQKITCTSWTRCRRCSRKHQTKGCKSTMVKCVNCSGEHEATSDNCDVRKEAIDWHRSWIYRKTPGVQEDDNDDTLGPPNEEEEEEESSMTE